jgi:hypothetical protein
VDRRTPFSSGGWLAIKSAIVGCAVFALVEILSIFVNTYLIKQIDAPLDFMSIAFSIGWFLLVFLLGSAITFIPAYIMGGFLAVLMNREARTGAISVNIASAKGLLFGLITAGAISLPILIFQYQFVLSSGHGSFTVFVQRAITAIVIASVCGLWTSLRLVKYFNTLHAA